MKYRIRSAPLLAIATLALGASGLVLLGGDNAGAAGAAAVPISQTPLTVAVPAHPQVILALTNSQSMDGTLAGAIMTGSGALAGVAALQNSSSPVSYTIPAGFTPPVNAGTGGIAPYTVTSGGNLVDNSASRLNVAKAGIASILSTFMATADFALMDYSTSGNNAYTTWVYYMSPTSAGFSFTNNPGTARYVTNPCYQATTLATGTVLADCNALAGFYGSTAESQPDMLIGTSSDDSSINDVLYAGAGSFAPVCVTYNTGGQGPSPTNPYGSLTAYNNGTVTESYNAEVNGCAEQTGPTNAGFVPFSYQVMYAERGFGFYTSGESDNTGATLVGMTTSGSTPTTATVNTAIAKFTPYLAAETNVTSTNEIKAQATQAPIPGLLAGALALYNTNPATSNGCAAQRYVVLMTDGLPTMDSSGKFWPPLGSASAAGYGVTATFNADGSLNTTNDQALTDTITQLKALLAKGYKTYIIGLGAGVDPSLNATAAATLTAMAVAGGTANYFPATSSGAVASDMQIIMTTILKATQSTSAVAVNSTYIHTGAISYQAQFTTSDVNQDWTGNVSAYPINATTGAVTTGTANAIWNAVTQLDMQNWNTGRLITTWDPVASQGIAFRWTGGTPTNGIATTTTLGQELETNTADPSGQDALNYLRGDRALEVANGGQYRTRTHVLGDIVDSAPLYVGAPGGAYLGSAYASFEATYANRPPVIYVGANDGMLHAFDAATGNERWAYIPNGVYSNLIQLTNPYYNEQHLFFVDGSPQAYDVQFSSGTWHTELVGGEAAGGKSIFAIDITNPNAVTTEAQAAANVLWEFTDANMGLTFSVPTIANTNAGFAVFFGNGYNSATQTPYLYALNPQTGAVMAKLNLCGIVPAACNTSLANGLSSVTLTNASGAVGNYATILYAGDLQGNLWRVDVSNSNPANWTATVLFQATDPSGNPQPITTAPAVTLNPLYPRVQGTMVFIGTGQLLGTPDLSTTQTQTVYGIYDSGSSTMLTRAALVQQTMAISPTNANLRMIT
jgi:type IV pilus assembly protein PilY1